MLAEKGVLVKSISETAGVVCIGATPVIGIPLCGILAPPSNTLVGLPPGNAADGPGNWLIRGLLDELLAIGLVEEVCGVGANETCWRGAVVRARFAE